MEEEEDIVLAEDIKIIIVRLFIYSKFTKKQIKDNFFSGKHYIYFYNKLPE
jgi:hypothetical protein